MPIYEYECSKCRKAFEVFQRITEEPLTKCKFCGGAVNRLISQCSFQLKGSGWYVTDYKHGGATSTGNDSKANGGKEEKTEVKTEPSKSETSKTDTSKTEPSKSETSKTETSKTEKSKTETSGGTT